jgi:hypothetical protein
VINFYENHIRRMREKVENTFGITQIGAWLEKNTFLNGRPYSFDGYEYQIQILADRSTTTIVSKPAQVGMSELSYRYAIGLCCTQDNWTTIYTFPTASDAEKNNRTRVMPLIDGSPEISRLTDRDMCNSELIKFGSNSFLFFKGTKSATQALSTPANCWIADEWDASDTTQASVYNSRLQGRPHRLRKMFSTPTVDKYGISLEAESAIRYRQMHECAACGHWFLPSYFDHVVVPGWYHPLEEITKANLHLTRWREAKILCPKCGNNPKFHHSRMQWVAENEDQRFDAHAYFVSPFSVPNIITPSYLVQTSTRYKKYSEFRNQALGLTGQEKNETLTLEDLHNCTIQADLKSTDLHVFGADMGLICHVMIGRKTWQGQLLIAHRERVPLSKFEERRLQLMAQYRCLISVHDSQPYVDLVTRLTDRDRNAYGAIFVTSKNPEMFTVAHKQADAEEGKLNLRLVKVNRTPALDHVMGLFKRKEIVISKVGDEEDAMFYDQMLSLKRVPITDQYGEPGYTWNKSDGEDHWHFALLYTTLAAELSSTAGTPGLVSAKNFQIVRSFRMKSA